MTTVEILFERCKGVGGDIGLVTLNRPQALNALTHLMIRELEQALLDWQADPKIKAVVLQGAGDKAFCAGGDIRKIYQAGTAGDFSVMKFFKDEYRLNRLTHHYSKPYISFLNGITMGGGVGISMHGNFPVATERFRFAMPETGIGFFPDVGGSYLLSSCEDHVGIYLGLTGAQLNAADAKAIGLITTVIPSQSWPDLFKLLQDQDFADNAKQAVNNCLKQFTCKSADSQLIHYLPIIARCFGYDEVEMILQQLAAEKDPWATHTAEVIASKSPTSLKVTLEQIRRGLSLSFDECMMMEEIIAQHFLHTADFYEGVRAALIDKDKSPHWDPPQLEMISSQQVQAYFQPRKK